MNGVPPRGGPPPSPPISVTARSSNGTGLYSANSNGGGRKYSAQMIEDQLQEHHRVLKRYLEASAREDHTYQPHNRARDKLLRLSPIQFQELSTDVYDELLRREDERQPGRENVPRFLLPKQTFHPKRNQARQKLSTLVTKKFRELSTDVLFELERRFPRFTGFTQGVARAASPSGSTRSSVRSADPRMRRPSQGRQPPPPLGIPPNGMPMRPGDMGTPSPGPYSPAMFSDSSRKQFQSNTMVPNKGTMVEDDDDSQSADEDGSSAARSSRRTTNKSLPFSMGDHNLTADLQAQIADLQQKVEELESHGRQKDTQIRDIEQELQNERTKSADLNSDLEKQLKSAESLNSSLQLEVDKLRAQNEDLLSQESSRSVEQSDWQQRYVSLEREFNDQQITIDEVRHDALEHLQEMRQIAERASESADREVALSKRVRTLETSVEHWKGRYTQARAQVRSLRDTSASSNFSNGLDGTKSMQTDNAWQHPNGLVTDTSITQFQVAVEELLRIAREGEPAHTLEYMRHMVTCVRGVTAEIESPSPTSPDARKLFESQDSDPAKLRAKLKMKVSAAANNLITTSKTFANSNGMAPVSLVDAAAGHLVHAVVELVKVAGVRVSESVTSDDDDDFR